jgi:hypothetical protein
MDCQDLMCGGRVLDIYSPISKSQTYFDILLSGKRNTKTRSQPKKPTHAQSITYLSDIKRTLNTLDLYMKKLTELLLIGIFWLPSQLPYVTVIHTLLKSRHLFSK